MTTTDCFLSRTATPSDQRVPSLWRAFLDRIMEARMRKAETEIAQYLQRCGRQLPNETTPPAR